MKPSYEKNGIKYYDGLGSYRKLKLIGEVKFWLFLGFVFLMIMLSHWLGLGNIHG